MMKEGPKLKLLVPLLTTQRREKAASEIRNLISELRNRVKHQRTMAGKTIQTFGFDEGFTRTLGTELDDAAEDFLKEKVAELELIAEEVMLAGVDEAD